VGMNMRVVVHQIIPVKSGRPLSPKSLEATAFQNSFVMHLHREVVRNQVCIDNIHMLENQKSIFNVQKWVSDH
jgi:hypothetical protein